MQITYIFSSFLSFSYPVFGLLERADRPGFSQLSVGWPPKRRSCHCSQMEPPVPPLDGVDAALADRGSSEIPQNDVRQQGPRLQDRQRHPVCPPPGVSAAG